VKGCELHEQAWSDAFGLSDDRWLRSGRAPDIPHFDGDLEKNSRCSTQFAKGIDVWIGRTKPYLSDIDMALKLFQGAPHGEAMKEVKSLTKHEVLSSGIHLIMDVLYDSFGERSIQAKTAPIERFEKLSREQAESLLRFCNRLVRTERDMMAHGIAQYDRKVRAWKFLEAARIKNQACTSSTTGKRQSDLDTSHDAILY